MKVTHLILKYTLLFTLLLGIVGCEKEEMEITTNESNVELLTKRQINLDEIVNNTKVYKAISNHLDNGSNNIAKNATNITIYTNSITYLELGWYHSYTFQILRDNAEGTLENLLLSKTKDDTYTAYIISYDLTDSDIEKIYHNMVIGTMEDKVSVQQIDLNESGVDLNSLLSKNIEEHDPCKGEISQGTGILVHLYDCEEGVIDSTTPEDETITDAGQTGGGDTYVNEGISTETNYPDYDSGGASSSPTVAINTGAEPAILSIKLGITRGSAEYDYIYDMANKTQVDQVYSFGDGNNWSEEAKKEAYLTIVTKSSKKPWINNSGKIDGKSQFSYTAYRDLILNGQTVREFKLSNGDRMARGNYALCSGCSESEDRTYYYNDEIGNWFEYLKPPTDCLSCSLNYLFEEAGRQGLIATARYATPIEDVIVLFTGKDLDGNESSRAVAGTFIVLDVATAGVAGRAIKAFKVTKRFGQGLEATNAVIKHADWIYKNQRRIVQKVKDGLVSLSTSNRKGNFGEMVTDNDLFEKGYDAFHRRVDNIDDCPGCSGIDHVFKNPQTGQFVIVESKFGSSTLSTLADGTKQMSDTWILDRLMEAVNYNTALYNDILINGYQRVLSKVDIDGNVIYKLLDSNGNIIGNFIP